MNVRQYNIGIDIIILNILVSNISLTQIVVLLHHRSVEVNNRHDTLLVLTLVTAMKESP